MKQPGARSTIENVIFDFVWDLMPLGLFMYSVGIMLMATPLPR